MKTEDLRPSSVREVIPSFPSQMALTQGALGREAQPLSRQLSCTPGPEEGQAVMRLRSCEQSPGP